MDSRTIEQVINTSFTRLLELLTESHAGLTPSIAAAARMIIQVLRRGRKVLLCGNGGSAADCQHFAAELVGRFQLTREALPAISLTTDTSIITALGNDVAFDQIFSRQIQALGRPGDVLVCISTSGASRNIIAAARSARKIGLKTIALVGSNRRHLQALSDITISVPSSETPRIQEAHALILHMLCDIIEKSLSH
ncbi:MAG: D-sedoheptulose 7-phosphate isomerase [candidate division WOR-3 bacterium]